MPDVTAPLFSFTSRDDYVLALVLERVGPTEIRLDPATTVDDLAALEVVATPHPEDPGTLTVSARRRETMLDRAAGILADHPSPVEDPQGLARTLLEALGARPESLAP